MVVTRRPIFDPPIVRRAIRDSFIKLAPAHMVRNPVMFVVLVGSVFTSFVLVRDLISGTPGVGFILQLTLWLWFTALFANFAEAMAEGRGKAQADELRKARSLTLAKRLRDKRDPQRVDAVSSSDLRPGDVVVCTPGDVIPGDGEVIDGVASVDESAITGESAPVIRESGGDRSAVTGGTRVLSDQLIIRITAEPGQTFLDRMIALVEGASRQKTPNEIALTILLSGLTIVFLLAIATLQPLATYSGGPVGISILIALLVCLIPTTIGGLLSAIGIAGMDRVIQHNIVAMSAARWRRPATSTHSCSTRRAPSRWGTGRRSSSCRCPASSPSCWPTGRSWPRFQTRPPKGAASSSSPRSSSVSGAARSWRVARITGHRRSSRSRPPRG
jgi:K+-transporting ATPase ATPase B chain